MPPLLIELNPLYGRIAFGIAFFFLFMSLLTLLIVEWGSASFYADIFAIIISFIFVMVVVWDVRRQATIPIY